MPDTEEEKTRWYQKTWVRNTLIWIGKFLGVVAAVVIFPVAVYKLFREYFQKESEAIIVSPKNPKKKVYSKEEDEIISGAKEKRKWVDKFFKKSIIFLVFSSLLYLPISNFSLYAAELKDCCKVLEQTEKEIKAFLDIQAQDVVWEFVEAEERDLVFVLKYRGVTKSKVIVYANVPLDKKYIKVVYVEPDFWSSKWPWIGGVFVEFIIIVAIIL